MFDLKKDVIDAMISGKKVKTVTYEVKLVQIKLNDQSQTVDLINILNDYGITTISVINKVDEMTIMFEADSVILKCLSTELGNKNLDATISVIEAENDSKKETTKSTKDEAK